MVSVNFPLRTADIGRDDDDDDKLKEMTDGHNTAELWRDSDLIIYIIPYSYTHLIQASGIRYIKWFICWHYKWSMFLD